MSSKIKNKLIVTNIIYEGEN